VRVAARLLRELRARLHTRAYELHAHGRTEAAQALWAVVGELDVLLTQLDPKD
jgi:hypothetical protein